ncbi:acetylating acetaldehyde dehydrogenase [Phytohabitans rumicis]|uniref:acetylating acetaldehyde dehydrogenase n=1 Tax=Phytohabitans rumicis TaxID=1076125 RepID=UPI001FE9BA83|nr:acetaldehyde dehydrogenase (acetylating) [Phytohabitans rumicis]
MADRHGVPTSVDGIDAVLARAEHIDLVFDATSAEDATRHWSIVEPTGLPFVDLTPAHLGKFCVPAINLDSCLDEQYLSMVTCAGQAAVPMAYCMAEAAEGIDYLELATATASATVGPGTRANLDEFVHTTEQAILEFSGVRRAKTVVIINPADPGIVMRNTIAVPPTERIDLDVLRASVDTMEKLIKSYVPGYRVAVPPVATGDRIMLMAEVEGRGDWFPRYAGNLDIITCAAIAVAEARAERRRS